MYLVGGGVTDILQEADVEEVPLATCGAIHGSDISDDVICVSGEYLRGICHVSEICVTVFSFLFFHSKSHMN